MFEISFNLSLYKPLLSLKWPTRLCCSLVLIKNSWWHVIKWKYFPRYWAFVRGIHLSPVNSPHKGQWRGALIVSLICVWTNDWIHNRYAGDLRHHRTYYRVTGMWLWAFILWATRHLIVRLHEVSKPRIWMSKKNIIVVTFWHAACQVSWL